MSLSRRLPLSQRRSTLTACADTRHDSSRRKLLRSKVCQSPACYYQPLRVKIVSRLWMPPLAARAPGLTSRQSPWFKSNICHPAAPVPSKSATTSPVRLGPCAPILDATRKHWGIEHGLHWVLDLAFREDESRVRKDHALYNFAILRHIALNLLKQEAIAKIGVKAKRLKAGWDEAVRLRDRHSSVQVVP